MVDFCAIGAETELLFASTNSIIKVLVQDVPTLSRGAQGSKAITLKDKMKIVGIAKY